MSEQALQAATQIERVLLGACLLEDEQTLDLFVSLLRPQHFALDSHKRIARQIVKLYTKQKPVNTVTVPQELVNSSEIETVGGWSYIAGLTEGLPLRLGEAATDHIDRLKEFWRKREIQKLFDDGSASLDALDSHGAIQRATSRFQEIVSDSVTDNPSVEAHTREVMDRWLTEHQAQGQRGLSFGIPDLDNATGGGMLPGQQTALGAASGVGKTTVLAQALYENARNGIPCHAFLFEPTREEIMRKLYTMVADVPYSCATHPRTATKEQRDKMFLAAGVVAEWPLRLDDKSSLTLEQVLGLARLSINRYGTRLIAVDYIQRMKIQQAEKDEQLRQRVGRASTELANLVKNTQCHSLLLSQLTTGRKGGADAMPTMYDFRESSQIENDAHTIVLLYRKYDDKQGHYTNEGAILVPKQRFGVPCNLKATFDSRLAVWRGAQNTGYFE